MMFFQQLRKPPTFFIETNPQALKHTQWQKLDQDFTLNHSASRNRLFLPFLVPFKNDSNSIHDLILLCYNVRMHTLHFAPGVLQANMEKLVSGDRFWSELVKVHFPTSDHLYFDIGHGNHEDGNN